MHEIELVRPGPRKGQVIYFKDTVWCGVFLWRGEKIHAMNGHLIVSVDELSLYTMEGLTIWKTVGAV